MSPCTCKITERFPPVYSAFPYFSYVPNAVVKDVLVRTDPEGRCGNWISTLLEYDVEIMPTNLVK